MTGDEALGFQVGAPIWPPPYDNFVASPAGEIPRRPVSPSAAQLDYAYTLLRVVFLALAMIGLIGILGAGGPRAVVREAGRRHTVQ